MAKFQLKAAPTFQAKVGFPQAGGDPVDVLLTFKHRTKDALDEFVKSRVGKTDAEAFLEMVEGWELDDEMTKENVELLTQNHMGVGLATFQKYIDELVQHRRGN
jgi:hypothetical protein